MSVGMKHGAGFLGWAVGGLLTLAVAAGGSVVVPSLINAEETPAAVSSASVDAASVAAPSPRSPPRSPPRRPR